MAKELIIAFVYDRERCQREEDDPHLAIIYFYPSWVSGEQQLLLCGQLIGVTHFFESTFATPSILSLQSGKFSMKFFGRYILCIGTDRNIPDSVLLARTNILHLVLQLYHGDFELFINSHSTTRYELYEKLSHIFEVYLPIMIFAGNIFNNLPLLDLPKSGSTVFLEASQMLQFFRNKSGALGGMILYKNKVVVSQLGGELTKALIASDPYRIKVPAAPVTAPYRIPFRVQLLKVYLTSKQYNVLKDRKNLISSALNSVPFWNVEPSAQCDVPPAPGSVLMKREKSRIFPVLEEEDDTGGGGVGDQSVKINGEDKRASPSSSKLKPKVVPDIVKDAMHARWISRLQTNTAASYIIPDRSYKLFKFSTTESIPNNVYRRSVLPIRYYSLGLPPLQEEWCNEIPFEDDSFKSTHMYYNTITDPINPLFRSNGMPASRLLYHERLEDHYLDIKAEYSKETDQCMITASDMKNNRGQGVPLTPLMAKLTMLANERQTPAATPSTSKQYPTVTLPSTSKKFSTVDSMPSTSSKKTLPQIDKNDESGIKENKVDLVESVLFIFGINSTTIMFLMEPSSAQDPTIIHNLWDSCTNTLEQLETSLKNVMEHCSNTGMSAADSYSYLSVEPDWGTTQRGGSWSAPQLELITTLNDDLSKKPHLIEFTVKCEESIVYGYQMGQKKVFFQQSSTSSSTGGLPTPADLMAFAHLKAKRLLERDHNVILL